MAAARTESLRKLDKKLKEWGKRVPEWNEVHVLLLGLGSKGHKYTRQCLDRTAATSGAAFLEHALRRAIIAHLRKEVTEAELKQLFDDAGAPLASFASRITMAQALGVIRDHHRTDLDTIRTVRNAFAHSPLHISFRDEAVRKLCFTLSIAASFSEDGKKGRDAGRMIYTSAVATLFFDLIDYYDGREQDIWDFAMRDT
jgi:hypothetical protein